MLTPDSVTDWLQKLEMLLPIVAIVVASIVGAIVLVTVILDILDFRRLFKQKSIFIELTPPARTDKTLEANQRLFSVLHGMEGSRPLLDKLLRRKVTFSLETVSTREGGIRYVWHVPESEATVFEQTIASYMPETRLKRVDDFLPGRLDPHNTRTLSFKQTGHFAYPLQTQLALERHDLAAYINGAMTQLLPGELIALQIVVSPAKVREAIITQHKLAHNEVLVTQLGRRGLPAAKVFNAINAILFGILDTIGDVHHGPSRTTRPSQKAAYHKQEVATRVKPARTLSALEEELADSVNRKLQQPLFRADIRAIVIANDLQRSRQRMSGIRNALDSLKVPKYQSLKARFSFPLAVRGRWRLFVFRSRLPSLFARNTAILSASEVADIHHFPNSQTAKTENVVKSLSKTLPAPLTLKNGTKPDVVLGCNYHLGSTTDIGLTANERERHIFIVGGTGSGKTTMIKYAAVQDVQNGKGVAIIDPHGDLAQELLTYIPKHRVKDVIYFNPDDLAYPIGLNVLELTPGLEDDELLREKDMVTEAVVSMFRKIFSEDDSGGHRIEYVLRNAIQTALTLKDATLFTVYDLLNNPDYRKTVVATLDNADLQNFWKNELGKAGGFQQVKMVAGITSKIGRFLFSASAKRILEQPKSTINFDEVLDGRVLICNFSKGLLGEDTSELFGISVLAKIQMAALRRARVKQSERRPFYLYVDEFQNFATQSFVQMLSESRKYKLFLTMAEQSTSQQDNQRMVNIILANVGTVICFRTGNPADEKLILPLFIPHLEEGDIANLPPYNFYIRASSIKSQEPFSGETLLLEMPGSEEAAGYVIKTSQEQYAKRYVSPESKERLEEKPKSTGQLTIKTAKQKVQGKDRMKERRKRNLNLRQRRKERQAADER